MSSTEETAMSTFKFHPHLSFNARVCWQDGHQHLDAAGVIEGALKQLWAEVNASTKSRAWVHAEPMPKYPEDDLGVLCGVFWFGAYKIGQQFAYEVRLAYSGANSDAWPHLEFVLETNWDRWMVMTPTDLPAGVRASSLWAIEGFSPENIAEGVWYPNLTFLSPAGRKLKRFKQFGRHYLGDWHGYGGKISLEIIDFPVPPHPSPQP